MISIHPHANATTAVEYLDDHLEKSASDYYTLNGRADVRLFGKGLDILGLSECTYSKTFFSDLAHNIHPLTKKQITPRRREDARSAYDGTISAPKSISVVALLADDPRIIEAHNRAVSQALLFMESRAMTRVRKNGADTDRETGNIAGILFTHFCSRSESSLTSADPQLHTHGFLFNFTHDKEENRFKALQSSSFYRSSAVITEIYRSTLAGELHQIGYRTCSTAKGLEIEGVSKEVIDLFSKRRKSILKTAQEDLAHPNSPKGRNAIARSSRNAKKVIPLEESRKAWIAQLSPEQYDSLLALKNNAIAPIEEKSVSPAEALDWAKRHLFERQSVIKRDELAVAALRFARGHFSYEQVVAVIENATVKGEYICVDDRLTIQTAADTEREMIDFVNEGSGTLAPLNEHFLIEGTFSKDQREVIGKTLQSTDPVTAIRGPAGAGKTTLMPVLMQGLHLSSGEPVILATSASAATGLRKEGFAGASTFQRFLVHKLEQKAATGRVVIVDEAGFISVNQMQNLLRLSKEHNFRVVLLGDTRQHHSVEWGNALQILENHSKLQTASLKEIYRQKNKDYRAAVSFLKDGFAVKGFDKLDFMGCVHEIEGDECAVTLANDFAAAVLRGESTLAVAPTWQRCDVTDAAIRHSLRANGTIQGEDILADALVPLHNTEAERELSHSYKEGNVLVFQRKSSLFSRGEHVTVRGEQQGRLLVERSNKECIIFDPKKSATSFQVYDPKPLQIAQGDKLLLRCNGQSTDGRKLINGEIVQIKGINGGLITLTDGRKIPSTYRHYTHGYCISSQASQGKTVDRVFLSMDAQSAHAASSLEGFYVAASRGRLSCGIYTDAKDELRDAVQHSSARQAAIELIAEKDQLLKKKINETTNPQHTDRQSVPNPLKLASSQGLYPLCRYPSTRNRSHALDGSESPNQGQRGYENPVLIAATCDTDLPRGGSSYDPVYLHSNKIHAPGLG